VENRQYTYARKEENLKFTTPACLSGIVNDMATL